MHGLQVYGLQVSSLQCGSRIQGTPLMQLEIPASGSATDCRPRPQGVPHTAFERKNENRDSTFSDRGDNQKSR